MKWQQTDLVADNDQEWQLKVTNNGFRSVNHFNRINMLIFAESADFTWNESSVVPKSKSKTSDSSQTERNLDCELLINLYGLYCLVFID